MRRCAFHTREKKGLQTGPATGTRSPTGTRDLSPVHADGTCGCIKRKVHERARENGEMLNFRFSQGTPDTKNCDTSAKFRKHGVPDGSDPLGIQIKVMEILVPARSSFYLRGISSTIGLVWGPLVQP